MKLKELDWKTIHLWDKLVEKKGSLFHKSDFRLMYEECFGYTPKYLYLFGMKSLVPLLLVKTFNGKKLMSPPFLGDSIKPLGSKKDVKILIEEVIKYGAKLGVDQIEFRDVDSDCLPNYRFESLGEYPSFYLKLDKSNEEIFLGFHKKLRNTIRRCGKTNLVVKPIKKFKSLYSYYRLYQKNMHQLGTPPLPLDFFEKLFLILGEDFKGSLCYYNNRLVGGVIIIQDGKTWRWYSGVKTKLGMKLNSVTHLLWSAIQESNLECIKEFDLGTSRSGSSNYNFKKRFTTEIVNRNWVYYSYDGDVKIVDPRNKKYGLPSLIWKKMPLSVSNYLGPKIRKKLGR